jgi:hypothetical protein
MISAAKNRLPVEQFTDYSDYLVDNHALKEAFSPVLHDVTTLYFESFKAYDFGYCHIYSRSGDERPDCLLGMMR